MSKLIDTQATLQRLKNRYRLVVMNDDTYEEVVTFKLNRLSVYIALCSVFVILIGFTVALIIFTPLKYYIPGYGNQSERRQLMQFKMRADSLERQMQFHEAYWDDVKMVLGGGVPSRRDTTQLDVPDFEESTDRP
ncbi:MAG: hypothetical protein ACO29O_08995 [Chitinophagaceae bacterium]